MRVLVLGAGYAGLVVARSLADALPESVELVVVDEHDYHLVQHELHRVVRRPGFADEIAIPLDDLLDRPDVRRARVEDIDTGDRTVSLSGGETLAYDVAAVCLGATTNFGGLPGVEEHATPLKRLDHARAIREQFLDVVDEATDSTDDEATARATEGDEATPPAAADEATDSTDDDGSGHPTVVVGGAGLSGVQVAGELAALAREEDAADAVRVLLLEQESGVAPGFPANFRAAVRDELEERGVAVRTGVTVEHATDRAIHVESGDPIAYEAFVWTGGIRGPDALGGDRPVVRADLALDDRTFVVGDAARVVDADGEAVPASAQAAVREARTAARNVARVVEGELEGELFDPRLEQFAFDARGWLVSVGDGAVAQVGPSVLSGRAAGALKAGVGLGYLASAGAVRDALDVARGEFLPGRGESDDGPVESGVPGDDAGPDDGADSGDAGPDDGADSGDTDDATDGERGA